ncbi:unnamed protein product [Knipowitschia caucasica]|uniref:Gastrin/cholecystokinin peptide hormone domain-containing protein n=1 Tax=Knipowitschia caucasica TaxID=637954 RepID=A0AAV2LNV6_KNICA
MHGKRLGVVLVLLACLLVSCAAGPDEQAVRDSLLQRVFSRRDVAKDPPETRAERRTHVSEDEREVMAKQLMHAISELMNSECASDRDYQGWVDFGRRDTEMASQKNWRSEA